MSVEANGRRLGINMQTIFGLPPVEFVHLTADLGCTHLSTALAPVPWKLDAFPDWSLATDPALRRAMRSTMHERGVTISLAEGFTIRPASEMRDRAADLDLVAELGARRASAVTMEPDEARALDQIAILAEMAAERDMDLLLEFAPPHTFPDLRSAVAALRLIGAPNTGLLLDAMHVFRSGCTISALAELDPSLVGYIQLCDAPQAGDGGEYYREASFERRAPGEGELPLKAMLTVLPRDEPNGREVPMQAAAKAHGLRAAVAHAVEAARTMIGEL